MANNLRPAIKPGAILTNEQMDSRVGADGEILVIDFPDEALEAAGAPDAAQTTIYAALTLYPLKPCGCAA